MTAWGTDDWHALARFQSYILDFFGPTMFVIMSIVGNMISNKTLGRERSSPYEPRKMLRVSFLIFFGEYLNIVTLWRLGGFLLTAWNIVLTIGVLTLILPMMLRLRKITRVALAIIILLIYFPLVNATAADMIPLGIEIDTIQGSAFTDPLNVIYWVFLYQDMMAPILPWLMVPLLASVIFEDFTAHYAMKASIPTTTLSRDLKRIGIWGIILVSIAIITSFQRIPDYSITNNTDLASPDAYFTWPYTDGIFPFLIRHTPQYMLYTIGTTCLMFAAFARFQAISRKSFPLEAGLNAIGKLSLTAFLLSLSVFYIPLRLPFPWFYPVAIPLEVGVLIGFWLWYEKGRHIASLEWFMDLYVNGILLFLERRASSRNAR